MVALLAYNHYFATVAHLVFNLTASELNRRRVIQSHTKVGRGGVLAFWLGDKQMWLQNDERRITNVVGVHIYVVLDVEAGDD